MSTNWTSAEIKKAFYTFFESKGHKIVPSAPIVVKGDPTLMFTNAGMNQFKDFFLNNAVATEKRIANSQKCLRVSGKHNDLEEVGHDHYHHTMFEMLGNWSFGDYFKEESIAWAWELLTGVYGMPKDRLYVTVFEGDSNEGLGKDTESAEFWKKWIDPSRILLGNKKDNFWEMGDTGPCGPCTEIHFDNRTDAERAAVEGSTLVNNDHEQVIEIWNLVFMQYNRKADGSLEKLPEQHVDTGMGFERLVRVIQRTQSNYDTDVFKFIITKTAHIANTNYGNTEKEDIAMRVIADHIRALCMCIADGQLPAANGAGYVVRRILRRAVRYGYSYLGIESPFLCQLVEPLAEYFKMDYPELHSQIDFVAKVVEQEEASFFRTLSKGITMLQDQFAHIENSVLTGKAAFELYDTYGFPVDLTELICRENGYSMDMASFEAEMAAQKARSKQDAAKETGDWNVVNDGEEIFVGYDTMQAKTKITRYRTVLVKGKEQYQVVLAETPFYAESGGQIGDTGWLEIGDEKISVLDCQKENKLHIHVLEKLPANTNSALIANVNTIRRAAITQHHSATHLMHSALRQVLGVHVTQKGSLVSDKILRFDFNHFSKVEDDQLQKIEAIVNSKIAESISLQEYRDMPIDEASAMGATMLFGEKYGDNVRVIVFDPTYSMELCGGTHVKNTQEISLFKFISESSVASGVRRVEAVVGASAIALLNAALNENESIKEVLNRPKNVLESILKLKEENTQIRLKLAAYEQAQEMATKQQLQSKFMDKGNFKLLIEKVQLPSAEAAKNICFQFKNELENVLIVLAYTIEDKPGIAILLNPEAINKGMNASQLVREWGKLIEGGGGGQDFFATAGGKNAAGLDKVIEAAKQHFGV